MFGNNTLGTTELGSLSAAYWETVTATRALETWGYARNRGFTLAALPERFTVDALPERFTLTALPEKRTIEALPERYTLEAI